MKGQFISCANSLGVLSRKCRLHAANDVNHLMNACVACRTFEGYLKLNSRNLFF